MSHAKAKRRQPAPSRPTTPGAQGPRAQAEQLFNRGAMAAKDKRWPDAAALFEQTAALVPTEPLVWMNLARARLHAGDLSASEAAARQALVLDGRNLLARRILAEGLLQQHRANDAVEAFHSLPADVTVDQDWLNAHGNALFTARRPADAVPVLMRALSMNVDAPLIHHRLGLCFKDMGMSAEAMECFRTAVLLGDPGVKAIALSLLVHESRQSCDWQHLAEETAQLLSALDEWPDDVGQLLSPFALLAVEATPAQQWRIGTLRTRSLTRGVRPLPAPGPRRPGPVRVGYLSCDFYQHATAVLMAELLEHRDTGRFEVTLYSHSPDDGSGMALRMRAACDHFVDVTTMDNEQIARRMREDGIDIAVDLKGHTRDSRFEVFAYRPAPVQMAYLGYPATTGTDFIDYIVGDPVVTPLAHADRYSERIAQMPHSYQPNDRRRALPPATPRSALALPEDAVVLCCFNQTYKMSPEMLDLWSRILHGTSRAVLWLLAWNPQARANLTREFAARGVAASRLVWADKRDLAGHIARLRAADVFLDTWPCNAHTTASEALWAGVPVLTCPGATYASRVAASLTSACGLGELVADSPEDYVTRAIALATDPPRLAAMKTRLDADRMDLPLFDTAQYARDYEALLMRMFDRAQAGLRPDHLAAASADATA